MELLKACKLVQSHMKGRIWSGAMQYEFCNSFERLEKSTHEVTRRDVLLLAEMCYIACGRDEAHTKFVHKIKPVVIEKVAGEKEGE